MQGTGSAMEMPASVVTLGESMVLFWPEDGGPLESAARFARSFGGAESNFAIALARLGVSTRYITRLGDDAFGRYIADTLAAEGVEVAAVRDAEAPTAVFFKERVTHGPRRVLYYRRLSAASRLSPQDLTRAQFVGARLVHLTGITPALSEGCAAAVAGAVDLARAAGALVSVDPNVRLMLWPDADACRAALHPLIGAADLVLLGDEDAAVLFPGLDELGVLDAIRALGVRTAVLKLGPRGAIARGEGQPVRVDAVTVSVVDTVGAGDGFNAGFVAALLRGDPLDRCLALGARIGAAAVAAAGDWEGYPTAADLARDPLQGETGER